MDPVKTLLVCAILLPVIGLTQEPRLPADAASVVEKLEKFEEVQRENLEKILVQKRKDVATYLEQLQDRETKAGRLENAMAIKAKIAEITNVQEPEKETKNSNEPFNMSGTIWESTYGPNKGRMLYFWEPGRMWIAHPDGGMWTDWKWGIEDGNVFIKNRFIPETEITIKGNKFQLSDKPGTPPNEYELKR